MSDPIRLYSIDDIPIDGDSLTCPFCGDGWHGEGPRELRRLLRHHLHDGRHHDKIASYSPLRLTTITGPYTPTTDRERA